MISDDVKLVIKRLPSGRVRKQIVRSWHNSAFSPKPYLNTNQAGLYLNVRPKTLANWRSTGGGPPYIKVGNGMVLYARAELRRWMKSQQRSNTAQTSSTAGVRRRGLQ